MSSDATYIPIGFSVNERSQEAVNSESAQTLHSLKSNAGSKQAEPTIEYSKEQLAGEVTDGPGESSDELLLAEAANGSKEAVGLLFSRYRRVVRSVARRILRDETEAEDLCQEVFLYLFQKAKIFDGSKGTASSWIVQIAYHRAMNRRGYLEHRQHYNAQELNEECISADQPRFLIDEIAAKTLLNRLRGLLSSEQRATLELHFFEGYTFREIAEKTNQPLGNVRHHYYRGLERLRTMIFPKKET
jgi:RNA polymerase sigma-70 factor, ECF subfamily